MPEYHRTVKLVHVSQRDRRDDQGAVLQSVVGQKDSLLPDQKFHTDYRSCRIR